MWIKIGMRITICFVRVIYFYGTAPIETFTHFYGVVHIFCQFIHFMPLRECITFHVSSSLLSFTFSSYLKNVENLSTQNVDRLAFHSLLCEMCGKLIHIECGKLILHHS